MAYAAIRTITASMIFMYELPYFMPSMPWSILQAEKSTPAEKNNSRGKRNERFIGQGWGVFYASKALSQPPSHRFEHVLTCLP